MKKYLLLLARVSFIVLFAISAKHFCKNATDGFTVYSITAELPSTKEDFASSDVSEITPLLPIFDQPFTYLAKGAQCYAFISKDGQYVIKFLKKKLFTEPKIYKYIPFYTSTYNQKLERKEKKLIEEFTSYSIALEELSEETGLVYLHLNKTSLLNKKITLIDRLNIAHMIDLDKTEFILQKKGDLIYPTLNALKEKNEIEEAKHLISSLCYLLEKRAKKNIVDTDPNVSKNFAVINSSPIQIDIGRFSYATSEDKVNLQSLYRMQKDFRNWLMNNFPEVVDHFDQEFSRLIQQGCY